MSFSSEVKQELLRISEQQESCCSEAQLYGLLLFGYSFNAREISLRTELDTIAHYMCGQLHSIALAQTLVEHSGRKWEASIPHPEDRLRVLERFGHEKDELSRRIVQENFACDACRAAFLRGVFLACAAVSAPQRQYHLEFYVSYKKLAQELEAVLTQAGLPPKLCQRKGVWLLYYKDSEQIEDTLASVGAQMAMLNLVNTKIEKDLRNNVNRVMNFEMANMDRASIAAAEQLRAIQTIRDGPGLDSLSEALRETALLREQNPEASLSELCEMTALPVTRSGMNHRLKKLVAIGTII
jgi:hypothetical protein